MEFSLRQTVPIDPHALSQAQVFLKSRLEELSLAKGDLSYGSPDAFLTFPFDSHSFGETQKIVKRVVGESLPKTVFVVGIGGANLASKAVYDALMGYGDVTFDLPRKMVFLDTVDVSVSLPVVSHIDTLQSKEDFFVVIVSKSGKTIETLSNAEFLLSHLEAKFKDVKDRIIVVSQKESPLWNDATEKGIVCIGIPENLSDRFGAFSPATLVPLSCFGFLTEDFLKGARSMLEHGLQIDENPSLETAASLHFYYQQNFHIYDLFFFSPRLETLGKWQRQLISESLGKEHDLSGNTVRVGITPTVSIGTTDLHSNLQLTLSGPREKITSFVSIVEKQKDKIGDAESIGMLGKEITERSSEEINDAILRSVQESYAKESLPYFDITLSDVSLTSLGAYMMFGMLQAVFLGALFHVNVFDQPSVEEYKNRTREILN